MTEPVGGQDLASQVLNMRRAGVRFDQIAQRLNIAPEDARALFDVAIAATEREQDLALEVDRLDRLHVALWPAALSGDLGAVDRVLKIGERRERLLGTASNAGGAEKRKAPPEPSGGKLAQLRSLYVVPKDTQAGQAG